jgi:SAM-dependent methyltransferase
MIDRFLAEHVSQFTQTLVTFADRVGATAQPDSPELVQELTAAINDSLQVCAELETHLQDEPQLLKQTQARYRAAIAPWFEQSWFMHRAISKPRGYPGDYELLSAIYDRQPKSRGIGGYLDRYFLATSLGRAVVSRMQSVRRFMLDEIDRREGKANILNVASGSGREYVDGFRTNEQSDIQITCVDNDPLALQYVEMNVAPLLPENVRMSFVRYNALRMTSAKANIARFGKSDIIYSVGLCDYIPDDYLIPMLKGWRESLAPGGVVYVAFKDTLEYDKTEYQWLTDWYFYQRTEAECTRLFEQAGYDMQTMGIERDATRIMIHYIARNSDDAILRVDAGETTVARAPVDLNVPVRESVTE